MVFRLAMARSMISQYTSSLTTMYWVDGFFIGPGDVEGRQPLQKAEDLSGDFQHVSMHATRPRSPDQDNPDCRNCN